MRRLTNIAPFYSSLIVVLALMCTLPGSARAGTYTVSSCDYAGGAQNSWGALTNHSALAAYSICPSVGDWNRGIIARNSVPSNNQSLVVAKGSSARQYFFAPAGTAITNVHFSGELFRAAGQRWNVALSNGSKILAGVDANTTSAYDWNVNDADIPVPGSPTVYWETTCFETSGCDIKSTGNAATRYVRAAARVRGTIVTVYDPTSPTPGWSGSLLSGGWIRGDQTFAWSGSDNTGIKHVTATFAGRGLLDSDRPCDYTVTQPCGTPDSGNVPVATAGYSDGVQPLHLDLTDAAGNPASLDTTVAIDNTAPARVSGVAVDGGSEWRATNSFRLTWQNPGGQHAPISGRHYRLCTINGENCSTAISDGADESVTLSVPGPGEWTAQVWLQDAAGNETASNASDPVTLRYDNTIPPPAAIDAPTGWIGDAAAKNLTVTLALAGGTTAPVSGIAGYSVTQDGSAPDATIDTGSAWSLSNLTEGTHTLKARPVSGSGQASTTVISATIHVDRTAPAADATGLPDPGVWQRTPATVHLAGSDALSGLSAIEWHLDDGPATRSDARGATVTVANDGRHTLTWTAIDNAGNPSQARQAVIRIDRSAPERIAIRPTDPAHPLLITTDVADAGSGVAAGTIELRRSGGQWRTLTTRTINASRLEALIDDSSLSDGRYELRATATDRVGNTRTSSTRADGSTAQLTFPVRLSSRVRLTSARSSKVIGVLRTTEGHAVAGAKVRVLVRPRTERDWATERTVTTDRRGRFSYKTPAGPSRTIRFAYMGADTVRPSNADRVITTPAHTSITASRRTARLHQAIVFKGALKGGHVPTLGKVLELQAFDGGRWRSFPHAVRTDRRGHWHTTLRFERTTGTFTYRIRARVFADSSYPFQLGYSRTIRLTVRGS